MNVVIACCAGLDVHKKTIAACVRRIDGDGQVVEQTLSFGTTTAELLALLDWLTKEGVTHVAMESTGVYWKPVFHILEGHLDVMLVNAHHIKHVPGRKTDVKDAQWIAELLQYGLLSPSFVPPAEIRELRDLTRQRTQLLQERAAAANRIQKVLEDANIKLASVASDPLGVSGRAMIRGLIAGEVNPAGRGSRGAPDWPRGPAPPSPAPARRAATPPPAVRPGRAARARRARGCSPPGRQRDAHAGAARSGRGPRGAPRGLL